MLDPILTIDNLCVSYAEKAAVYGVSFDLGEGQILGMLGLNGSGKSTVLRAITGTTAFAGTVLHGGHSIRESPEQAKSYFGLAIEADKLPFGLTCEQYLSFVASMRGGSPSDWSDLSELIAGLGLNPHMHKPIGSCSLGTKQKVGIVGAFVGHPPLLIFDESLNGLDPVSSRFFKDYLSACVRSRKCSAIMATHYIDFVYEWCHRALLLRHGSISNHWLLGEVRSGQTSREFEHEVVSLMRAKSC